MAAPFPKWVYDLAVEIERGIRGNNPAHIELARLLPSAARTIGQMFVDYEELSAPAATAPAASTLDDSALIDTSVIPVVPLHLSPLMQPVTNPGETTATHMIPANGASS